MEIKRKEDIIADNSEIERNYNKGVQLRES